MMFKIYDPQENALFFYSVRELAAFCDVAPAEARKACYQNVTRLNGFEVINYRR